MLQAGKQRSREVETCFDIRLTGGAFGPDLRISTFSNLFDVLRNGLAQSSLCQEEHLAALATLVSTLFSVFASFHLFVVHGSTFGGACSENLASYRIGGPRLKTRRGERGYVVSVRVSPFSRLSPSKRLRRTTLLFPFFSLLLRRPRYTWRREPQYVCALVSLALFGSV